MKKETVNTFEEGLNYDLNPLVTPNNLLTDVVNGTFITFNGNELSLQNDAGNMVINITSDNDIPTYNEATTYYEHDKVAITDSNNRLRYYECVWSGEPPGILDVTPSDDGVYWSEYIVRLSPGFYPIAVKEYGGVLYIISRKQIGSVADPTVDLIEFGSFPSPIRAEIDDPFTKNTVIQMESGIPNILELPKIINETIFRAGEYTTFETTVGYDIDFLSTQDEHRFYKLKLLQQLPSGYLDLTDDIEEKYYAPSPGYDGQEDSWILDSSFIYSCPFLYKGNLMLKLEVEPLLEFEIISPPVLEYVLTDDTFKIRMDVSTEFWDNNKTIQVDNVNVDLTIDGIEIPGVIITVDKTNASVSASSSISHSISVSPSSSISNSASISSSKSSSASSSLSSSVSPSLPSQLTITTLFHITIENISAELYLNKVLSYTLTPHYIWSGYVEGDEDNLPETYREEYEINGMVVLSSIFSNVRFPMDISREYSMNNVCGEGDDYGYRIYDELVITNGSYHAINNDLEMTDSIYVLVRNNGGRITIPSRIDGVQNIMLATYTMAVDGLITIDSGSWVDVSKDNKIIIQSALNGFNARVEDDSCKVVELTINISGEASCTVTISQSDFGLSETFETSPGDAECVMNVVPNSNVDITIDPNDLSYEIITDSVTITEETIYNYALIGKIVVYEQSSSSGVGYLTRIFYIVVWDNELDLGDPNITITKDYLDDPLTQPGTLKLEAYGGVNKNIFAVSGVRFPFTMNLLLSYEFTSSTTLASTYKNISNPEDFVIINDVIFHKLSLGSIFYQNEELKVI